MHPPFSHSYSDATDIAFKEYLCDSHLLKNNYFFKRNILIFLHKNDMVNLDISNSPLHVMLLEVVANL